MTVPETVKFPVIFVSPIIPAPPEETFNPLLIVAPSTVLSESRIANPLVFNVDNEESPVTPNVPVKFKLPANSEFPVTVREPIDVLSIVARPEISMFSLSVILSVVKVPFTVRVFVNMLPCINGDELFA